jgi:flagellar protein FliS
VSAYQDRVLEGASAVELVVALYDGIMRFLQAAANAAERGDQDGRRVAVRRALDIIIHLQARLRMDIGGSPAQALSEFYASVFAQILQASQAASPERFQQAISCVRNVRDAWRQVAQENQSPPQRLAGISETRTNPRRASDMAESLQGRSSQGQWTA